MRHPIAGLLLVAAVLAGAEPLTPRWDETPAVVVSPTRGEMVLNDVWRIAPAVGDSAKAPAAGASWGLLRVPGSWSGFSRFGKAEHTAGSGPGWQTPLHQQGSLWYQREITVPAGWSGRRILLDLDLVSTDARVLLDDAICGTVAWPAGSVDLTAAARPGTRQRLSILVVAANDRDTVARYMDAEDVIIEKSTLGSRGLTGDVVLRSEPADGAIAAVTVQTSVRRKRLDLIVELPPSLVGVQRFTARILDLEGREVRRFDGRAAASDGVARLGWEWADARRWDLDDPYQHLLALDLHGADGAVRDTLPVRFGFRELLIEGRGFTLNGVPLRLRPVFGHGMSDSTLIPIQADHLVSGLLSQGFNCKEIWPVDPLTRGSVALAAHPQLARAASGKGMLITACAPDIRQAIADFAISPEEREQLLASWRPMLRRMANEPSVVMWGSTGNFFGYAMDQDPRLIGRRDHGGVSGDLAKRAEAGAAAIELMRPLDPTRPIFCHHGGAVGDLHTINMYLGMIPLQERMEWLEPWRAAGQMPFMAVEFGVPLHTNWHRGRNGFRGATTSEPLVSEYAARDLGARAYAIETPDLRRLLAERFQQGQTYRSIHGEINHEPAIEAQIAEHNRWTWRAWRTWGVSGGMIPWGNGHGWRSTPEGEQFVSLPPFVPGQRGWHVAQIRVGDLHHLKPPGWQRTPAGDALVESNGPTLAWIAGRDGEAERDRGGFTDRTAAYRAGAPFAKQAVVINDTRREQPFALTWRLVGDAGTWATGSAEGRLPAGSDRLLPIACTLPSVATRTDAVLELDARIGDSTHSDRFPLRVHPPATGGLPAVAVLDRVGDTTRLLGGLTGDVQPWDGSSRERPLVIGRRHLSTHGLPKDFASFVHGGGRVLIMAQDPDWLRRAWKLRVGWHLARQVFPVSDGHPVLRGLDQRDLALWRGSSTLLEPRPDYRTTKDWKATPARQPYAGWRWGGRHAVSSAMIEIPHHAGWRPILVGEFDLAYSPLLELDHGAGKILLCTLDLEDHAAADPAAELLTRNLLHHLAQAPITPRRAVHLLGSDADAGLLASLGLDHARVQGLPADGLVIIGDATVDDAALRAFIGRGGAAVILPRQGATGALGTTLRQMPDCHGSLAVPAWPELRGVNPSLLRWRAEHPAWLLDGGCEIGAGGLLGRVAIGSGVAILLQNDPRLLPVAEKTYFRLTRWRQTRLLAQILANLGAAFQNDRAVFTVADAGTVELGSVPWQARMTLSLPPSPSPEKAHADPGITPAATEAMAADGTDTSGWTAFTAPRMLEQIDPAWGASDGEFVARCTIELNATAAARPSELLLGALDDFDVVQVNGITVGQTDATTPSWWSTERRYRIPPGVLRVGANRIVIRLFDAFGGGGLMGGGRAFQLRPVPDAEVGPYHADYRDDFPLGDDPFRYYRW